MSYVELLTVRAIVQKIAYVISNCVAAFLVRSPHDWPGAKVLVDDLGRRVVRVRRPDIYIDSKNSQWPEFVELPISLPAQLLAAFGDRETSRGELQKAVDAQVQEARATARRDGRAFQSPERVMRAKVTSRSGSWEDFGARFPLFSAAGDVAAAVSWLIGRRAFLIAYQVNLERMKLGALDVLFPAGTWKLKHSYGVRCRASPA
jgi:hypothetical protein